jgi:hypothetical protein
MASNSAPVTQSIHFHLAVIFGTSKKTHLTRSISSSGDDRSNIRPRAPVEVTAERPLTAAAFSALRILTYGESIALCQAMEPLDRPSAEQNLIPVEAVEMLGLTRVPSMSAVTDTLQMSSTMLRQVWISSARRSPTIAAARQD